MIATLSRATRAWVEIAGLVILCGIFLYWDLSRAIYILAALAAVGYLGKSRPDLDSAHKFYALPIYVFVGVMLASVAFNGFDDSGTNAFFSRYLLLLLAVPYAGLCYLTYDRANNIWLKFGAAGFVLGLTALIDFIAMDKYRADGGDNAVIFGFVTAAIVTVLIASFRSHWQDRSFGRTFFCATIAFGLVALLLSGSRGGWLALLITATLAIFLFLDRYAWPRRLALTLVLPSILLVLILVATASMPMVKQRMVAFVNDLDFYFSDTAAEELNSTSNRVETWKVSAQIGLDNLLLGTGPGSFRKTLAEYADRDDTLARLKPDLAHAHNQYMQSFATTGLVGLAALFCLLLGHIWAFSRYLAGKYSNEVRSLAMVGVLMAVLYMLLGLTGVPLERKKLILVYGFSTATCWGYLLAALKQSTVGTGAANTASNT